MQRRLKMALEFKDRLRMAIKESSVKQSEIARTLKISNTAITYWLNGTTTSLKYDDVIKLSKLLGVNPAWLMEGKGSKYDFEAQREDIVSIEKLDILASCGALTADVDFRTDSEIVNNMEVGSEWFKNNFSRYNPDEIKIVTASGDSMNPTIEDGDLVFINVNQNVCDRDGIYFLFLDGQYFIKRVQRTIGRKLLLISENPRYRDIEIEYDSQVDFRTIGKVIKTFKSIDY